MKFEYKVYALVDGRTETQVYEHTEGMSLASAFIMFQDWINTMNKKECDLREGSKFIYYSTGRSL